MKIVAIVQTRMGSSRLPGKVLYPLLGKPVISQVISRLKKVSLIDEIVIATTDNLRDQVIVEWAKDNRVKYFIGDTNNVLERYLGAANSSNAEVVIRITSDCPLIDSNVISQMLGSYLSNNLQMITNSGPYDEKRTYPRGLDVEIFPISWLKIANDNAKSNHQLEHVTPYFYENFQEDIVHYLNDIDYSNHRWTLDTIEDYQFINEIYSGLLKHKSESNMNDIIDFLDENKELLWINKQIVQKKY